MHGQDPPTTRWGFRTLALVAASLSLVLVGLTGCDDGAAEPPETFDYVALGDSFTATGLPVATGDCRRSSQNYPQLVARARPDINLVDASCGGAASKDMLESQEFRGTVQPPQFDSLPSDADLVTVSLGGNDFGLYWRFLYRCVQLAPQDPKGHPCRTANGGRLEQKMDRVRDNLAGVLEEAVERAPDARVIFVGYPRLLPEDADCPKRVPVASGDVAYVRKMMDLLVDAQRGAAEDAGVDYVDVYAASEGHDVCSDSPWVNDVTDGPRGSYNFHPMPAHQRAVADLILEML